MFDNIGNKIKGLAKVLFIVLVIADIIVGIVLMSLDDGLIAIGLPIMLGGPVIAWISSWILYGFGQLIENSDKLVESVCKAESKQIQPQTSQCVTENATINPVTEKGRCEICGKEDVPVCDAKIVDNMGTRYRRICMDCYKNNNASPAE